MLKNFWEKILPVKKLLKKFLTNRPEWKFQKLF